MAIPEAPSNSESQLDQLRSLPPCQCRESLVALLSSVNTAAQEKQLDQTFQRMQRVVDGFLNTINCVECSITCTDLICLMAAFQQTGSSFAYIAQGDLGGVITANFSGHEVLINDPKLRAMLVTTLIYNATLVLDSIGAKGRDMLGSLCPATEIAHTNIAHLNNTIEEFRLLLRSISESADRLASPPEQASSM